MPNWPPPFPTYVRRETLSRGNLILIVVLALILIGGGLGFIVYATTAQYRGSLNSLATAYAQSTAQERATVLAQEQGTASYFSTANADIYASATAQSGATATLTSQSSSITATATTFTSLLATISTGTPALNDPLTDNSMGNQWDTTHNTAASACIFNGTDYEIDENQLGYVQPCFAEATNYSGFAYQASIVIDNGNEAGLVFCANSAKGSYYLFRFDVNGDFALDAYSGGKAFTILQGSDPTDIAPGLSQSNTLAVIVFKGTIDLFANQAFIASVQDNSLASGMIGLAALDTQAPTKAEYTNAQVWTLSALPTVTPGASFPSPTTTTTVTPSATASPSATP